MESLKGIVSKPLIDVFLNYHSLSAFTLVQQRTITDLLNHKDVIVQSPTGSGKTLAYVIPAFELLLRRKEMWRKWQIGVLILVPSRELATQVASICQSFIEATNLRVLCFSGGRVKSDEDVTRFKQNGANIVISTPGRFEDLLVNKKSTDFDLSGHLKSLELLVVDEADRFIDLSFQKSMTEILSSLPKQRRTGLFSATQAKQMEQFVKFGLRNPIRITTASSVESTTMPVSLQNFYTIVPADQKLSVLFDFIRKHDQDKLMIFLSTCACVDYFLRLLRPMLGNRQISALHGRKRSNRIKVLDRFRQTSTSGPVLLCTDLLSRGIDVPDIDWVVQFDIPKQSSWFVHRSGRTGRCGKLGQALLILTPEEADYPRFLESYEKVSTFKGLKLEMEDEQVRKFKEEVQKMALDDRDILERGSTAFVSFVQFYSKHDCHLVCSLKDLDIIGFAHCYCLLRLPRMKELAHLDLSQFHRYDIDTASIAFKDKKREKARQARIANRTEELKQKQKQPVSVSEPVPPSGPKQAKKLKRRIEEAKVREWDELVDDFRLLKKFKRGKLSKKEFDDNFGL